jgi:uncharacterized OsmC-like protein
MPPPDASTRHDAAEDHRPVSAVIEAGAYRTTVTMGPHTLLADHEGAGPGPFDLLLASLCSCVLMTVRMYAARKQWPLREVRITATPTRKPAQPLERVALALAFEGDLSDEQRTRLLEIASRCPVHRTLHAGVHVDIAPA